MSKKFKVAILYLILIPAIFGLSVAAFAAPPGGTEIVEIHVDYDGQIAISGRGLSDGVNEPIVHLAGSPLSISAHSAELILVDVNLALFEPGDYLLTVDPNYKKSRLAESMLTLGAAGPQGPEGPPAVECPCFTAEEIFASWKDLCESSENYDLSWVWALDGNQNEYLVTIERDIYANPVTFKSAQCESSTSALQDITAFQAIQCIQMIKASCEVNAY